MLNCFMLSYVLLFYPILFDMILYHCDYMHMFVIMLREGQTCRRNNNWMTQTTNKVRPFPSDLRTVLTRSENRHRATTHRKKWGTIWKSLEKRSESCVATFLKVSHRLNAISKPPPRRPASEESGDKLEKFGKVGRFLFAQLFEIQPPL